MKKDCIEQDKKGLFDCPDCLGLGLHKMADMCDEEEIKNGIDKCVTCNGTGLVAFFNMPLPTHNKQKKEIENGH